MGSLKPAIFKTIVNAQNNSTFFKKLVAFAAYRSQQAMMAANGNSEKQKELERVGFLKKSLKHPLKKFLPEDEFQIRQYLESFHFQNEPVKEMAGYLDHAFYRFLLTLDLVPPGNGSLLEIGANPYFMSLLLDKYTEYELTYTNHFGEHSQLATDIKYTSDGEAKAFSYSKVNLETDDLPYPDHSFDVVLYCEVIEHLYQDSLITLNRIKRVLKPNGYLILTTPNVGRLENVIKMLNGHNIYDPYSGYGVYGRHNREFTPDELRTLVTYAGFAIEKLFTSDVTDNHIFDAYPIEKILPALHKRENNLGEYIFVCARNTGQPSPQLKPRWLYRSYPNNELTD